MTASIILKIFITLKLAEYIVFIVLELLNMLKVKANATVPKRYIDLIPQLTYLKSRDYSFSKQKFCLFATSFDLTLLILFILLGGFEIFERLTMSVVNSEMFRAVIFCFALGFAKEIIDLPFSLYGTFVLEEKFGFNKITFPLYVKDFFKSLILGILFGTPVICFIIWTIQKANDFWWIYGFSGLSIFQLIVMWIYPTIISPIFNKFTPLEKGELRDKIMKISENINFKISEIFLMDGSKRSGHSNAYFTGIGKNKRIVLFDTLVRSLSTDELVAVLSHEMGHHKLNHIKKSIALSFMLSFASFYIWSILIKYPPLYQAFKLQGNNLFPALVIFPLIMSPIMFFISPLLNIFSRKNEYEADSFAAKATNSPKDMQNALLKLNKENLSNLTPHPWYSFFYYSHPTLDERLDNLDSLATEK
ncbi:MAG: hypothetical protein ACD_79C00786G0004 [uncultured bacterium]|nr:MAG: hypothetical protein ACD_79C00786G0004 [uncultured bacterium]